MIDLSTSPVASPHVHHLPTDPGRCWTKDATVAIEAPPDDDLAPQPDARWSPLARRTGLCGAVGPRVVALPGSGYRLYYSQMLPRPGNPTGANDYDHATTRILSAYSSDGATWTPEPGVRLSPEAGGAGEYRVVSSEVVPIGDGRRLRMYYECCAGPQSTTNSIRSAISTDGLDWTAEPGVRVESAGHNYASPRILFLNDGRCRLYYYDRGNGIISAVSDDGGLHFHPETGVRITQDGPHDSFAAFACEIFSVADSSGYIMYYAGYSHSNRAHILRATSADGLIWQKDAQPVISPDSSRWDAAKCSEMALIRLAPSEGTPPRYRLLYEACDGTAPNERGVWRIASATSQ